jgi:hypothetical protein
MWKMCEQVPNTVNIEGKGEASLDLYVDASIAIELTQWTLIPRLLACPADTIKGILANSANVVFVLDVPHPVPHCAPLMNVHLHIVVRL